MAITSTTTVYDNEKYLDMELLERTEFKLVASALCDQDIMPQGNGLTAYMIRYARMSVPLVALTEGTAPSASTFSLEQVTVTLDQWGDYIDITDIAELTTKHPIIQEAMNLLADNAARVMDREVQIVMLAGTNVTYGDGSVITRATVTDSMVVGNATLGRVRAAMVRTGVPPVGRKSQDARAVAAKGAGGQEYLAVCGPEVIQDIMATSTSFGTFVSVATYANQTALYNSEVGTWLGFRWVETNFIPQFKLLGGSSGKTAAVVSGNAFGTDTPVVTAVDGGGSLTSATTYYFKVTRKSLLRGFEEDISMIHSMASTATANNESFTFDFSACTAGYVYNVYFGISAADSALKLVSANIAVGATLTVITTSSSTTTAPANIRTSGASDPEAVHPIYLLGNKALGWTGFYKAKFLKVLGGATKSDVLDQHRYVGYKFMGKAVIKNTLHLLRLEVSSAFDTVL